MWQSFQSARSQRCCEKNPNYIYLLFLYFSQLHHKDENTGTKYQKCTPHVEILGNPRQLGDFSNQHLYNQGVFLCYKNPCRLFLGQDTLLPDVFHLPSWEREDHGHRLEKETQQQPILVDDRCGRSQRREDDDLRTRGRQDHEDNQPNIIT